MLEGGMQVAYCHDANFWWIPPEVKEGKPELRQIPLHDVVDYGIV